MINEARIVRDLFAFGGSAGGLEALLEVLRPLPREFPGTIGVVLHRSPVHVSHLASLLAGTIALPVKEPADGEAVESGHVYLAPRDFHMTIEDERWRLDRGPKRHRMRPAVDPLLISAAAARGERAVGVLLSGGGGDGVDGLIATAKGGLSIVRRPDQARVQSMPMTAIQENDVDCVLRADEIASVIQRLAEGQSVQC
jgi:two-component system chemotaxis response regulator CheB